MLLESLQRPTKGKGLKRAIITLFCIYPGAMIIVPVFTAFGMIHQVLVSRAAGERAPPEYPAFREWRDWLSLTRIGVRTVGISLAYLAFPLTVMFLVLQTYVGVSPAELYYTPFSKLSSTIPGFVLFGLFALFVLVHPFVPAALINVEVRNDGRLRSAFAIGDLADLVTSRPFVLATIFSFVGIPAGVAVIAYISVSTLQIGLGLAPLFIPWLFFYWGSLYGAAYHRIERRRDRAVADAETEPAPADAAGDPAA